MLTAAGIVLFAFFYKPFTVFAFVLMFAACIPVWFAGVACITIASMSWRNAARHSRAVRVGLRLAIAGFIAFVILAPIMERAHAVPVCATVDECNKLVPLVPGTTPEQGKQGQNHVMQGMLPPPTYNPPLRLPTGSQLQNNPFFVVDHHAQWRT